MYRISCRVEPEEFRCHLNRDVVLGHTPSVTDSSIYRITVPGCTVDVHLEMVVIVVEYTHIPNRNMAELRYLVRNVF